MELRHLRYFRAVAETLNFSRAAEQLRVAQPALSRQVKALENELGVQLLERNRVRVQLTDAGRLFLGHVEKVLAQVDMAVAAVREVSSGLEGRLIVCTEWRLPVGLLPAAIAEFRRRFPRVEVDLRELPMVQHLAALRAGKAHLGFLPLGVLGAHHHLNYLPVLHSELSVIVPAQHPLARRSAVQLAQLKDESWLTAETHDTGYRNFLTQTCRLAGFSPRFGKSTQTIEGLIGLAGAGFGVALLPEVMVHDKALATIRVLRTDCDPIEIGAVWNVADDSKLLHNFIEILRQAAARVVRAES